MLTSIAGVGSYLRAAQTSPSRTTLTPADALPATDADKAAENQPQGIPVSQLKQLDMSGMKLISAWDIPEIRDRMATSWLDMHGAASAMATEVPDDAPQNIYARVKVDGKVVATLYNGGSVAMTGEASAKVGDLDPGSASGPNLAQSRAEKIAKATGGTIEKASTAITQSQWTPRPSFSQSYSRAQLDAAFQAMMAEGQRATARRYSAPQQSLGGVADINA